MGNSNVYFRLGIALILPTLGIITSVLTKPSIDGAIAIINQWGAKEHEVLQNEDLKDFKIKRAYEKASPSSHRKVEHRTDVIKRESLKFAKHVPIVFFYPYSRGTLSFPWSPPAQELPLSLSSSVCRGIVI